MRVDGLAPGLLGTHVGRRAENDAQLCWGARDRRGRSEAAWGGLTDGLRQPEVKYFHPPLGSQLDVCWLEVAVNDSAAMGGFERLGYLPEDGQSLVGIQRTALQSLCEVLARKELQHEDALALDVMQAVDGGDVWVVHGSQQLRLSLKTLQRLWITGEVIRQDLQRHFTVERLIEGFPHHAHPTLAHLLDEPVVQEITAWLDRHEAILLCAYSLDARFFPLGVRDRF